MLYLEERSNPGNTQTHPATSPPELLLNIELHFLLLLLPHIGPVIGRLGLTAADLASSSPGVLPSLPQSTHSWPGKVETFRKRELKIGYSVGGKAESSYWQPGGGQRVKLWDEAKDFVYLHHMDNSGIIRHHGLISLCWFDDLSDIVRVSDQILIMLARILSYESTILKVRWTIIRGEYFVIILLSN